MERSTTKVIDMDFLWFDSMKRSEEGTMKWQWGLHVALTGTAVVPPVLKWHDWKHSGDAPTGTWKVPLSLAWPHLVPNWPKCPFFKSGQRAATVWAESRRWGEKLLLIWLLHPEVTHKSRGLFRACSFWWMYSITAKSSPVYRKHLDHQTWCNVSIRNLVSLSDYGKTQISPVFHFCDWVFTCKLTLFSIPAFLGW